VKEIDVNMPALRLLTPQGLQRIYEAALQVLDEVGMEFDSARALDLLEGAGCRVDRVTCRVHFPPELSRRASH
jgi:trimethylamine--corrinoid protein Co-methyltransferase